MKHQALIELLEEMAIHDLADGSKLEDHPISQILSHQKTLEKSITKARVFLEHLSSMNVYGAEGAETLLNDFPIVVTH